MHPEPVSMLGLGAMGTALAGAFLRAGHPTTVWNRTPARAHDLISDGAIAVTTPVEAVAASRLAVICLLDAPAVGAVLDTIGDGLRASTIVNLTSSTPEEARALSARVIASGARYLDGKIMVPTSLVGTDGGFFLYSGDSAVFAEHEVTLRSLGGDANLLGDDPGQSALYDLGMLGIFFNGMASFLHAAALVGADGVPARTFLPYAERILAVLRTSLPGLAIGVDTGKHPGAEDNLDMELAALDHIVRTSEARHIDTTVPAVPRGLAKAAIDAGHGRDSFSRVIDLLRQSGR
jgi:3-hydroxyisobutyrate dehydrogenase-like beta-hydroxyacid dehydrogenase